MSVCGCMRVVEASRCMCWHDVVLESMCVYYLG